MGKYSHQDWFYVLVCLLGSAVVLAGIFGNVLVIIAVYKKRFLRSTTNYLLVNMAVADIMNLGFLPFMLLQNLKFTFQGHFLDFLCKFIISYHIPITSCIVSVETLVVLAVERYHAIVKPMRTSLRLREDTVRYAIIAVWLLSLAFTSPLYIFGYYDNQRKRCKMSNNVYDATKSLTLTSVLGVVLVFIPFFVITFCYVQIVRDLYFSNAVSPQNVAAAEEQRSKRSIVKVALSVTVAFFICFFPTIIALFLIAYDSVKYETKLTTDLAYIYVIQSAVNPALYAFQSANYRQAFKEILRC